MADRDMPDAAPANVCDGVAFVVIPSAEVDASRAQDLENALVKNGANRLELNSQHRIQDMKALTHIISSTTDFPDYDQALDKFIPVVKPDWVDQTVRKGKQSNPRLFSPDRRMIMSDVTVFCVAIPEGDKEAIAGGVIAMGGQYSERLTKMVTHLVTLDESHDQCQLASSKNLQCHILLPHWFEDCLRLGRRISEAPYMFPNPEILQPDNNTLPTPRNSTDIDGALSHDAGLKPELIASVGQKRPLSVINNRRFKFGVDLELGENMLKAMTDLVTKSKGHVVEDIADADVFVCKYRHGVIYQRASQAGVEVGNLAWFYHLITHDTWTSPLRRPLHYPIPLNGIAGFEKCTVSISNYTGSVRIYLQSLVEALGANFSKMMTQENTHLVVAHLGSEKCDAAREWNIEVVNHLWLEESFAKCEMQRISDPRYTHFPARTNLGEIVGQTPLDRKTLERFYFAKPTQRKAKAAVSPPKVELDGDDKMSVDEPVRKLGRPSKKAKTDGIIQTPATKRIIDVERENQTPSSTSSRGAKDRALSKLHVAAKDIALYEKELKRVGGVTHGRSRGDSKDREHSPSTRTTNEPRGTKRKSLDQDDDDAATDVTETTNKKGGKAKVDKLPPITQRVMITTWQRWTDNPDSEQADKAKLRNLGLFVIDDSSNVNILCAPRIVKTKKFICAMANAPHVLSTDFLESCIKHNKVPTLSKFTLSDRDGEERLGLNLLKSLARADKNKHHLLKGWQIFCTEQIAGGFATYNEIIRANGGSCAVYKGRNTLQVSKRLVKGKDDHPAAESQGNDSGDTLYMISGTSKEEVKLWTKFRELARQNDMEAVIARAEWLLLSTLSQEIRWEDSWALSEDSLR